MDILVAKKLNGSLVPCYDSDREKLKSFKIDEPFLIKAHKSRNIMFHRKFFALIKLVFDNQENYKSIDHLREDLIIESGFYTLSVNVHGEEVKRAQSISFGSMTQEVFEDLFNRVLDVIEKYFHFDKEEIKQEIINFY